MPPESEPTDVIDLQVTHRAVHATHLTPVSRPMTAVMIRHVPGGIVSASCGGVTASGMTEEIALRELARKVEQMRAVPLQDQTR